MRKIVEWRFSPAGYLVVLCSDDTFWYMSNAQWFMFPMIPASDEVFE